MKQINLKLFLFEELSSEIQQKVIEQHRYVNTAHNWYEYAFDDFIQIGKTIGISLESNSIFFSGFSSQGDGSTFSAHIDPMKFIYAMKAQAWKAYAPDIELNCAPYPCAADLLSLMEREILIPHQYTRNPSRGFGIQYVSSYDFISCHDREYTNIERELEKLDSWVESILNALNQYLYKSLESEYDYLLSDSAVQEILISDEHYFIASGEIADHLLDFTVEQVHGEQE
jgi:hypothetical protein